MEFTSANLKAADWHKREAAILAIGTHHNLSMFHSHSCTDMKPTSLYVLCVTETPGSVLAAAGDDNKTAGVAANAVFGSLITMLTPGTGCEPDVRVTWCETQSWSCASQL